MSDNWYQIENADEIPSPALLVYPERIRENIRNMVELTGDSARLRPHVKTHKMAEVIKLQVAAGIVKFKCATIAELEMCASAGGKDLLLAYQPVGPNVGRMVELCRKFPDVKFAAAVDRESVVRTLSEAFSEAGVTLGLMIDLDVGMHRTGIEPGPNAFELYRLISVMPGVEARGLHAYDGHNHTPDLEQRTKEFNEYMVPVRKLRDDLQAAGLSVPCVVASGTPTFPLHAAAGDVECSPGTTLFMDFGYGDKFPDVPCQHAAALMVRVVSKPGDDLLCMDLGYKAVAAENPHPRVKIFDLPVSEFTNQSEEHLVARSERAGEYNVGDVLYGIPRHICPTVAHYAEAVVVENGRAVGRWEVTARNRKISI
jgi:D-serine deaminase-like pyridoxal phosphate-dependent protein